MCVSFLAAGARKVSTEGGWAPLWSPDGTEIFYQSEDGRRMMAVEIDTGPDLRISDPGLLFEGPFQRSTDIYYQNASGRRPFPSGHEQGKDEPLRNRCSPP
jgi:hypothetical protein